MISETKPKKKSSLTIVLVVLVAVASVLCIINSARNKPAPTVRSTITSGKPEGAVGDTTFTTAERAYMSEVAEIGRQYGDAFTEFSGLTDKASQDSSLLLDDDWKGEVTVALATVTLLNNQIQALDPPGLFADAHEELLDAAKHYDKFVSLFAEGIDDLDTDKMSLARKELSLGNESINNVTAEIKRIGD